MSAVELIGSEENPFTGMTHIFYAVPGACEARLTVYDVSGRAVRTLLRGRVRTGYNSAVWDGKSDSGEPVASGVYFIGLSASGVRRTAKVVLER